MNYEDLCFMKLAAGGFKNYQDSETKDLTSVNTLATQVTLIGGNIEHQTFECAPDYK
jgi:hypothetical protein